MGKRKHTKEIEKSDHDIFFFEDRKPDKNAITDLNISNSKNEQTLMHFSKTSKAYERDKRKFHKKQKFNSDIAQEIKIEPRNQSSSENDKNAKKNQILDSIVYYEKILQSLKGSQETESNELYTKYLKESQGNEVELASCKGSSYCIELLLSQCNDITTHKCFMEAFLKEKLKVCTNGLASHITELLIYKALLNIQNLSQNEQNQSDELSFFISWIREFGEFSLENLSSYLNNIYSCHIVCTIIRALSGCFADQKFYESKNSFKHKKHFHQQYSGNDVGKLKSPITLEQVPKFFCKLLKKFAKSFMQLENIKDYVADSCTATVIEALLFALNKRLPQYCNKFIFFLASEILSEYNADGVPLAFLHKNSSYVVEKMFDSADENVQQILWNEHFANCLSNLIKDPIGNYIIQRIFDVVTSKSQFEIMSETIGDLFDPILKSHHYGILLSIASCCNRLKSQQAQFMKSIMECLHCVEPEDRQLHLVPLLLSFQTYENYFASQFSINKICLQGSLLTQALIKFQKPIKIVKSILNMKSEELLFLAGHIQGCHVLTSFFESINVGEKNKDKLINNLKAIILPIAQDRNRSLTLCRIWVLLSIKQKSIIAKELLEHEQELQTNQNSSLIMKKFGIFWYRRNYEKWKEQQSYIKKKF